MEDIKSAYEIADWSISPGGGATGYGHHTARYAGVRLINKLQCVSAYNRYYTHGGTPQEPGT